MNEKNNTFVYFTKYVRTINLIFFTGFFILSCLFFAFQFLPIAWIHLVTSIVFLLLFYLSFKISYVTIYMIYWIVLCNASISIFVIGWDYGFQLYFFILITTLYSYQNFEKRTFKLILLSLISILFFMCLRIYCYFYSPIYVISLPVYSMLLSCFHGIFLGCYMIYNMHISRKITYETEQQLKEISEIDELTNLYNRRKIQTLLNKYFSDAKAKNNNLALSIFDLDNFKIINDNYGHLAGDYVLREIAKNALEFKSDNICIGRWGGEEFMIISTGKNAYKELIKYVQNFNQYVYLKEFSYKNELIKVSITAGITPYTQEYDIIELINRADRLLYEGKTNGKNCVIYN